MIPLHSLLLRPLCAAASLAVLAACDPPGTVSNKQTQVLIEFVAVDMPRDVALEIASEFRDPHKRGHAFSRVEDLIREKKARVWAWQPLTTKSGQRAVIEQIDEFRYATEFMPPEIPLAPAEDGETASAEKPSVYSMAPTAFETRNVGVTLEIEPVVNPGGETIDLNLVPQHVRMMRMNKIGIGKEGTGERAEVEQPQFYTMKLTTSLNVKNGEPRLLGQFVMPGEEDRMELFIIRATAQAFVVRSAAPTPAPPAPAPKPKRRTPFGGGAPGG